MLPGSDESRSALRPAAAASFTTSEGAPGVRTGSWSITDAPVQHGRVVPGKGWYDGDYLGIDQGPILAMIENQRSGLVWNVMRKNPHIVRGLRRAGFSGGWLDSAPPS